MTFPETFSDHELFNFGPSIYKPDTLPAVYQLSLYELQSWKYQSASGAEAHAM